MSSARLKRMGGSKLPHPKKDLAKGLLKSIEKQASISLE